MTKKQYQKLLAGSGSVLVASTNTSRGPKRRGPRAGDWQCARCRSSCFGSKSECFKCGAAKGSVAITEEEWNASKAATGGLPAGGGGDASQARKGVQLKHIEVPLEERRNARFDAYYRAQRIVPEEDWDTFIACMRSPLPVVIRVDGGRWVLCCSRT